MIRRVGLTRVHTTVMDAYNLAQTGDILLIDEGIYKEELIFLQKYVHLVGNTLYPGESRVILESLDATILLSIGGVNAAVPIYFEGITFRFIVDPDDIVTSSLLYIHTSANIDIVFNRCILDASFHWPWVVQITATAVNSVTYNNCSFIFKETIDYPDSGPEHYQREGYSHIDHYYNKCISSYQLEFVGSAWHGIDPPIVADYVTMIEQDGYGPNYGTTQLIPTRYYFSGNIYDEVSDNILVDNVVFDILTKPTEILLTNSLLATVPVTYRYAHYAAKVDVARNTGKWYWEVKIFDSYGKSRCGVSLKEASKYEAIGDNNFSWGYKPANGTFYTAGEIHKVGNVSTNGDVICIAYDAYNGKIWWGLNGHWILDGDPSTGTNPIFDELNFTLFPSVSLYSSSVYASTAEIMFNKSELRYPIPEGYDFYGTKVVWRVKCIDLITNELTGQTTSDALTQDYFLETSSSGSQFLICEDASVDPTYNDLLLGHFVPEVLI